VEPRWENLFDLLHLQPGERSQARDEMLFYITAMRERAKGVELYRINGRFLDFQGAVLLSHLQRMLRWWEILDRVINSEFDARFGVIAGRVKTAETQLRTLSQGELIELERRKLEVLYKATHIDVEPEVLSARLNKLAEMQMVRPETRVFRQKQELAKMRRRLAHIKSRVSEEVDLTRPVLEALTKSLQEILSRRGELSWSALFQFQYFTAAIEDLARHRFLVGTWGRDGRLTSFGSLLGFDVHKQLDRIQVWSRDVVEDSGLRLQNVALNKTMSRLSWEFEHFGFLPVLTMQPRSLRVALALGFLPINAIRFHVEPAPVPAHSGEDFAGGSLMAIDLIDAQGPQHFRLSRLNMKSPNSWLNALNRSWTNWFALLGGRFDRPVRYSRLSMAEGLLHSVVYLTRYADLFGRGKLDWASSSRLVSFFLNDFLFEADPNVHLRSPVADLLGRHLNAFRDLLPYTEAHVGNVHVARALDSILARLCDLHGVSSFTVSPETKALLQRFPRSAVTSKLIIVRHLMSGRKPD
jgi:hypothetical protein